MDLRFLRKDDFTEIHRTFLESYSDYIIKTQMTETQLANHVAQNGVEYERSVGAFTDTGMIGVTLNGFGLWNGVETVYDAGTGVIPKFRRQGIGRSMFDFMMPKFKKNGVKQMLLEVISTNEKALQLYRNLGFEETRRLLFFEQNEEINVEPQKNLEIREIENPDWHIFECFRDGKPSWQNSNESIARTVPKKIILGAFLEGKLVGYGIVMRKSGNIVQFAVDKKHRGKGIASQLLKEGKKRIDPKSKLRFTNVDESIESLTGFLKKRNFSENLMQIEMIWVL